jgi:hypothetical protein
LKDTEVVVSRDHTMWFDDPTFQRLIDHTPLSVTSRETFRWQRTAASTLDRAYLVVERALSKVRFPDRYLDYQHFYCLKQ